MFLFIFNKFDLLPEVNFKIEVIDILFWVELLENNYFAIDLFLYVY